MLSQVLPLHAASPTNNLPTSARTITYVAIAGPPQLQHNHWQLNLQALPDMRSADRKQGRHSPRRPQKLLQVPCSKASRCTRHYS